MPGIRQRSKGSWEVSVFLGRDENGQRVRVWETVKGTKGDALPRQREILSEMDRGIVQVKTKYRLGEWLDKWMQDKIVPNGKQKTIDRYGGIIRKHIKPALGRTELTKLSPAQVQDFETQLLQDNMKPKGVGLVHTILNGAMKHALKMELITRNPVALVSPPTIAKKEAHTPEIEQVRALLKLAEQKRHPLWVCIHLIAYTGMRRGEGLALEWKNVDLDNMRVVVTQSLVATQTGILLETPKTENGQRVVDLDHRTTKIIRQHRDNQRALAVKSGINPPEKLFPRHDLVNWTHPNTVRYAIQTLGKQAGCPDITLRSLRHFHATITLQAGENPVVVSKRIGHSNPKITMEVYAHALPGWQKSTAEAFADAMEPEAD